MVDLPPSPETPTTPSPAHLIFDDGLFRQRERTVDNIKRIYAVVYSLSLTNVLRNIFDFYQKHIVADTEDPGFAAGMGLRMAMMAIFISTISVFALQADKFLDLRYALRPVDTRPDDPMPCWNRGDFAWDAASLIFSLVPFILMSYAFEDKIVSQLGILPFLAAYLLLFWLSLVFLQIIRAKYLASATTDQTRTSSPVAGATGYNLPEDVRYGVLSIHWFATNGLMIFLLVLLYSLLTGPQELCGSTSMNTQGWLFVAAFVILAIGRNMVDYWSVWPFLYINSRSLEPADLTSFLRRVLVRRPERRNRYDLFGPFAIVAISYALLVIAPALAPGVCPKLAPPSLTKS